MLKRMSTAVSSLLMAAKFDFCGKL